MHTAGRGLRCVSQTARTCAGPARGSGKERLHLVGQVRAGAAGRGRLQGRGQPQGAVQGRGAAGCGASERLGRGRGGQGRGQQT